MRLQPVFVLALAFSASPAAASWWSSSSAPEYTTWNTKQLRAWLEKHNVYVPTGYSRDQLQSLMEQNVGATEYWTLDKYEKAQKAYADAKDTAFETWDDSRLRGFLAEQGVVAPNGPREQLVLAVNNHYTGYTKAASSFASSVSGAASTAVFGDSKHQASKSISSHYTDATSYVADATDSISSVAAQASASLVRAAEDSKDYIYSSWDDSRIRDYLVEKNVIEESDHPTRDQMLAYMRDSYAAITEPIWNSWSDSYMHEWLVAHGVIKSDFQKNRDSLVDKMKYYYYTPQQQAWESWTESDMRKWLIDHDVIKSDAELKKGKMQKLIADNYANAADTVWGSWTDSDLRAWLQEHGYLRTDAEIKRDELIKLMNDKYSESSARNAAYLTWPDARLRAFLRNHNMPEDSLPTTRPGLLQECRIRYVRTTSTLELIFTRLRALVSSGVVTAEETLGQILELLSGVEHKAKGTAKEKKSDAAKKAKEAKEYVQQKTEL